MEAFPEYNGPIGTKGKYLCPALRKAYRSRHAELQRCNNKNHPRYKYYGAKGIRVDYTARELLFWIVESIDDFSRSNFIIGRIDHNKNYSIDNIRIESPSESSKDVFRRHGSPSKYQMKRITIMDGSIPLFTAFSFTNAAKFLNIPKSTFSKKRHGILNGRYTCVEV